MSQKRQKNIELEDIIKVARNYNAKIKNPGLRINNNISSKGKIFDMVLVDKNNHRIIITIIGH